LQAVAIPLLGQTFDPLNIVMFDAGTLAAGLVDRVLLERAFFFWTRDKPASRGCGKRTTTSSEGRIVGSAIGRAYPGGDGTLRSDRN